MSVASELSADLTEARADAEALMTDTCTIAHHTGQTTDGTTFVVSETYGTAYYSGKCKVAVPAVEAQNPEAGDAQSTVLRMRVDVPMTVTGAEVNDLITVTSSTFDPDLVGKTFRVTAPFHGSHKTARRLPVEESP